MGSARAHQELRLPAAGDHRFGRREWGLRRGETEIRPTFIEDYLDRFGAHGEVIVRSGAWNTGWHHGEGFLQWTGGSAQKEALERVRQTSDALHQVLRAGRRNGDRGPDWWQRLEQAHWRLLRSETSCNYFWGDAWVPRCHHDLDEAWRWLDEAKRALD